MTYSLNSFFQTLWQDYLTLSPSAEMVHQVIQSTEQGANIVNDHVAFRTFNQGPISLDNITPYLTEMGYVEMADYAFESKHLRAKHFEFPGNAQPKIFLSELLVEQLSQSAQRIIYRLIEQIPADLADTCKLLYAGRLWELTYQDYQRLQSESEYAAWTAAWGFHANHFTVSVNHLKNIETLSQLNQLLKEHDFILNQSGGEIKGGKNVLLAQSSTMADPVPCKFIDGTYVIPGCFYEFAQRYNTASGERYHGFVAASADKIFESTDAA